MHLVGLNESCCAQFCQLPTKNPLSLRQICLSSQCESHDDGNNSIVTVDNPQALPKRPTCFSSREDLATRDSHRRKFFRRPATARLNPCQATGLTTPHSSLLETSLRLPPVEAMMVTTIFPPASSWTRAPACGRRRGAGWGRCCRIDSATLELQLTRPSS